MEPTGPRIFTSALHAIAVPPSPASESVKEVSMFMIAPTPLPLIAPRERAEDERRSPFRLLQQPPDALIRVVAVGDDRAGRVLNRRTDGVDAGAAALAHALRPERRERRWALGRAGRERRHVER